MKRLLPAIALLLAAIPVIRWYAARMQDGGGETAGLVPLLFAGHFIFQSRNELSASSVERGSGIAVLAAYTFAFPLLPPLVRALLFIVALALVSGVWRKPGILLLLVLSLPLAASLDFFFGYPLRLLTSIASENLLGLAGLEVRREGVRLLHVGGEVGVDPACSGLNMLWTAGLFTALLTAFFSLPWRKILPLGFAALALSLAGNSLRASLLFFPESGLIEMPHILHPAIGLVIAAAAFAALAKLARSLSDRKKPTAPAPQPSPHSPLALTIVALCAAAAPLFSKTGPPDSTMAAPQLEHFHGQPVTRIALSPAEEKFYSDFPGSIAVYEGGDFKLTHRHVTRATRKLHPASHCLRAEGFSIGVKKIRSDDHGNRWLTYTATRNGTAWTVSERIRPADGGRQWAEISAWYWSALFHPQDGPWVAETVIAPL